MVDVDRAKHWDIKVKMCYSRIRFSVWPLAWNKMCGRNPNTSHPPKNNKTHLFQYNEQFGTLYR